MLFKRERKFAFCARAKQDCCVKTDWNKLQKLALEEIEATLEELPKPLCEQARKLPVTFEKAPNLGLQADGIEMDTLGLFTGAEFADDGGTVLPPQIILFLENLWDFAEEDEEVSEKNDISNFRFRKSGILKNLRSHIEIQNQRRKSKQHWQLLKRMHYC